MRVGLSVCVNVVPACVCGESSISGAGLCVFATDSDTVT